LGIGEWHGRGVGRVGSVGGVVGWVSGKKIIVFGSLTYSVSNSIKILRKYVLFDD
jgi:hypothetical protein